MLVPSSSNMDLAAFSTVLPSQSIALSLGLSVIILCLLRLAFVWLAKPVSASTEKHTHQQRQRTASWGVFTWENLPVSIPVSLTAPPQATVGKGVGVRPALMSTPRQMSHAQWQTRKGPAHQSRYSPEVPASMAKIIMSRHTFRKPSMKKPSPPPSPTSPMRPQSMV